MSWTSLKKLSLRYCKLSDEFIAHILSGCPILEILILCFCHDRLNVLDLSNSPRLRTLDFQASGPTQIVAPHIHCLRLRNSRSPCALVDVSSLTEAKLDISHHSQTDKTDDSLHIMVLEMLNKCQNVEKLTLGENFLKILSLAELRGVLFQHFKAKVLTLETTISHYIIPAIVRVLQNSPELKELTLVHIYHSDFIQGIYIDQNLCSHGLNSDQCWSLEARVFKNNWSLKAQDVASFIELVLKTTKILEKMVVRLKPDDKARGVMKELLEMVPALTRNNNVSIVVSSITKTRFKM